MTDIGTAHTHSRIVAQQKQSASQLVDNLFVVGSPRQWLEHTGLCLRGTIVLWVGFLLLLLHHTDASRWSVKGFYFNYFLNGARAFWLFFYLNYPRGFIFI
jgi:hypothetical protein